MRVKARIPMARAEFNKKILFNRKLKFKRKKLVKCYIWSIVLYSAEIWTFRKVDQKGLGSFKMWCCRRMGEISWTNRLKNEEVLNGVQEERKRLHTIRRKRANGIGHSLRRNCLLKHVIEEK
jgi:hypothetical protein